MVKIHVRGRAVLVTIFLTAVLLPEFAQSLRCFSCREPSRPEKCRTVTNCMPNQTMCMTTMHSLEDVFSLVCWSCDGAESNWGCWRWQICSNQDNYCVTTYTGAGFGGYSGQSISKGCVPVCPQGGIDIGVAAMSIKCCSSFLCNISGANSIQVNHLVLALATLASFFYLFGSRL